jgi:hypothetical protein
VQGHWPDLFRTIALRAGGAAELGAEHADGSGSLSDANCGINGLNSTLDADWASSSAPRAMAPARIRRTTVGPATQPDPAELGVEMSQLEALICAILHTDPTYIPQRGVTPAIASS